MPRTPTRRVYAILPLPMPVDDAVAQMQAVVARDPDAVMDLNEHGQVIIAAAKPARARRQPKPAAPEPPSLLTPELGVTGPPAADQRIGYRHGLDPATDPFDTPAGAGG